MRAFRSFSSRSSRSSAFVSAWGFALLALTQVAAPAAAQDAPKPKEEEKKPEEAPERPRRGGFGGTPDAGQVVEFLSKELDLTGPQEEQIKKIVEAQMAEAFAKMAELWGSGDGEARDKARKVFEDIRISMSKKISEVLTPSQKREFEVLVEQFDRRARDFEEGREVQDDVTQLLNPKPGSKAILMAKAERLLFLPPDETAVLLPYIEAVVNKRIGLYEGRKVRRKDLLNATRGGASKEEVGQRLEEIRAAERFQQLELAAAQADLRGLLTIEQEVRFVASGILD